MHTHFFLSLFLATVFCAITACTPSPQQATTTQIHETSMTQAAIPDDPRNLTDEEWQALLSDQEYRILRRAGTERAGTGRYLNHDATQGGAFHCVGCGQKLYDASHKFHSGCGWPSFFQEVENGAITLHEDTSHGMLRTEMRCSRCDGHLGHVFRDAPDQPTGLRHCVNGDILVLVPEGADIEAVFAAHREAHANE